MPQFSKQQLPTVMLVHGDLGHLARSHAEEEAKIEQGATILTTVNIIKLSLI